MQCACLDVKAEMYKFPLFSLPRSINWQRNTESLFSGVLICISLCVFSNEMEYDLFCVDTRAVVALTW